MTLKSDAKFKEKLICFKNDKNLENLHTNTEKVSKICTLILSYCGKYLIFDLKKYRGVIFHDTEELCKIWRKTDLWFGKWHEEFGRFSPEHSKISKICTLMSCFWPKYIMFELKKYRGVMFDGTEDWCKIWRKTDLCFQKWHEEFNKFWPEHSKISKICTLMGCFWPKYIMFELKKVQRSYVWWHWILMQNLKENWLVLSKMTWRIWQICIGWNKWIAHLIKLFTHV